MAQNSLYARTKAEAKTLDISPKSFWENGVMLSLLILFLTSASLIAFFIWIFTL